jgi:hypothetical protein
MMPPGDYSSSEKYHPEALTGIHGAYTLAATNEHETGEVEQLMIRHFIETLAEISLSIASRLITQQEQNR